MPPADTGLLQSSQWRLRYSGLPLGEWMGVCHAGFLDRQDFSRTELGPNHRAALGFVVRPRVSRFTFENTEEHVSCQDPGLTGLPATMAQRGWS